MLWLIAISSEEALGVEREEDALAAWLGMNQIQTKRHGGFEFTPGVSGGGGVQWAVLMLGLKKLLLWLPCLNSLAVGLLQGLFWGGYS